MTVLLKDDAPRDSCTVDLTPRRCQRFRPESGTRLTWTNTAADDRRMLGSGEITTDQWELVTLEQLTILKGENRIIIKRK
jgi:hypothetical protein